MSVNSENNQEVDITVFGFLYSLFNKHVFYEAKANVDVLDRFFRQDFNTKNSTVAFKLLKLIKEKEFENITVQTFQNEFEEIKTPEEITGMIGEVVKYKAYSKSQAEEISEKIKKTCYKQVCEEGFRMFPTEYEKLVDYVSKYEYKSSKSVSLVSRTFGQIDVNAAVELYSVDKIIPSRYPWINRSFSFGGFLANMLVTVSAAPGVGKSLYLMSEADHFIRDLGLRVHYTALGDLTDADFIIRMGAQSSGETLGECTMNIREVHKKVEQVYGDKFKFMIVPSMSISSDAYYKYVSSIVDDFDVFIVDYDGNFLKEEENMYAEGGVLYDRMIDLCRTYTKLGMIASQPKQPYWNCELLPIESLAESSRKQQITDFILTFGKAQNAGTRCGKGAIVKNRRGSLVSEQAWVGLEDGTFFEVSDITYKSLKNNARNMQLLTEGARNLERRCTTTV